VPIARHAFGVHIEPVDFINTSDAVRQQINTWVAEQTEQRIKDLLPPRAVGPATKLVIVNAIYFLADWATPFDKAQTQPRDFWINGTAKRKVPTMQRLGSFRHAAGNGAA
jgi:serpin B